MVIGLVAFSSAIAIGAARAKSSPAYSPDGILALDLVDRARGAAASQAPLDRSVQFDLTPDPNSPDPDVSRVMPRVLPTPAPTALPTPVAPPTPAPRPIVIAKAPVIVGSGQLAWPVPGGSISQYFSGYHLAIDIAAPYGTSVAAADDGVVTWAGWRNNGGGFVVEIDHGNGIVTAYNHLGTVWVGPGEVVVKGQGIAPVGCTGLCTGPHVHFQVIVGGVIVNPLRYL